MENQEVIGHLLDVERQASELIRDAQTEADRRKALAVEAADAEFRAAYAALIGELEAQYAADRSEIDEGRARILREYEASLAAVRRDGDGFGRYVSSLYTGK
jgi:vacuolar-type H+-ATPase subunit H